MTLSALVASVLLSWVLLDLSKCKVINNLPDILTSVPANLLQSYTFFRGKIERSARATLWKILMSTYRNELPKALHLNSISLEFGPTLILALESLK